MKKILVFALFGLLVPFTSHAADVPSNAYFFGDGKGYDESGNQKYYCFGTGASLDCYSVEGVFVFVRQVQSTIEDLQNKVNELQNTVNQLQSQPVQQPVAAAPVVVQPVVPADTTAPKVKAVLAWECISANNCSSEAHTLSYPNHLTSSDYYNFTVPSKNNKNLIIVTDEPTTVKVYFIGHSDSNNTRLSPYIGMGMDAIGSIGRNTLEYTKVYESTSLSKYHTISYQSLTPGIFYMIDMDIIDGSGNKISDLRGVSILGE